MTREDVKQTRIWDLYEKGRNFHRIRGIYDDTDRNYRMYNGNQWAGAKLGEIEPVQKNFIKPIVKYKVSVIHDNLYAINFSSLNFENNEFRAEAEKICDMLNGYAARVWEKDKMDFKGRRITKDAAINDEGIIYVDFDKKTMQPVNEIIKKCDVYYGNENNDNIEEQPYILIRKRMPVINAVDLALSLGADEETTKQIIGDNDTFEESGEAAKDEIDDMVTVIYKFYKYDDTVRFAVATRYCNIADELDLGITRYPIAHLNWEEKEGSARGEGEVRYLIPNQIEVNRTEMRRVLTVKYQAYPQKVVDASRVENPDSVNRVGAIIKTQGNTVDDVKKIVSTLPPAQMSPDVRQLQDDLISVTRELAGAGDMATGSVNPESASGRAILAVQQASQAPMTEQKESYKNFIEDVAHIWLEYLIAHSADGLKLEEKIIDPQTRQETVVLRPVVQSALRKLQATIKVDVTPKSVYDKFAQEQTIENLLTQGLLTPARVSELEIYAKLLDDDSVAPKIKILEAIKYIRDEQKRIAEINAEAQKMRQRVNQFLNGDPQLQASQMSNAANAMARMNVAPQMPVKNTQ